jgi:uncharacterized membrane-anchored protein
MRFPLRRKAKELSGRLRADPVTKHLAQRLRRGEIALIAHQDIDRLSAELLVRCRPRAVLNALDSCTGAYANAGPEVLLSAGMPLIDRLGPEALDLLKEGARVTISQGTVRAGPVTLTGRAVALPLLAQLQRQARAAEQARLADFAENTLRYVREEAQLLYTGLQLPELRTRLAGRECVVAVRGDQYEEDLETLRPYIRDRKPVLLAVDGAADKMLELGLRPHVLFGDMDSVSDEALRCGAELVAHGYLDGRAPGLERLRVAGLNGQVFRCLGTSEDAALLLAHEAGAGLIVAVGTHSGLTHFLDKGRPGMASTFLTRLRVSSRMVDARGVNLLYRTQSVWVALLSLAAVGLATIAVIVSVSPFARHFLRLIGIQLRLLLHH